FTTQAPSNNNDWRDFNNVAKALRTIATAQGWAPHSRLPDTKLLKQLGHQDLVHAIRKKHGGFGRVAEKLGVCTSADALEVHKMVASRAARRQKRHARLAKHDFH
uniref:Uncharacterized protein n=1 Tax=Globisporangium ultimum (strain ATCC 200006 / CBS 805.95 / DAOM BR144) TaxID=431595 RepID=K3WMD8_GLOUD